MPSTSASSAHAELGARAIKCAAAGQTETNSARLATAAATTSTDLLRNAAAIASRHRDRDSGGRDCAGWDCAGWDRSGWDC